MDVAGWELAVLYRQPLWLCCMVCSRNSTQSLGPPYNFRLKNKPYFTYNCLFANNETRINQASTYFLDLFHCPYLFSLTQRSSPAKACGLSNRIWTILASLGMNVGLWVLLIPMSVRHWRALSRNGVCSFEWKDDWWMMYWKEFARKLWWIVQVIPRHLPEGTWRTTKNLSQDTRCTGSNRAAQE
jgi:hypothetical protein